MSLAKPYDPLAAFIDLLDPPDRPEDWQHLARPEQLPPDGDWLLWLIMAGRGWGKTRTGAETIVDWATSYPNDIDGYPTEWQIFAENSEDIRNVNFRGPSGVLNILRRRQIDFEYNKNESTVTLPSGALIRGRGADDEDVGRGLNLAGIWIDEIVKWSPARLTKQKWLGGILPALRAKVNGWKPRAIVTTSPKPLDLLREWVAEWREQPDGRVRLIRGSTFDNAANLSDATVAEMRAMYEGTRLGRQELYGELLEDVEGALWTYQLIDSLRVQEYEPKFWHRMILALDPADGLEDGDEQGLAVVGHSADHDQHLYVRYSEGLRVTPWEFVNHALEVADEFDAEVVVEKNHGGAYIPALLQQAMMKRGRRVPYRTVDAGSSKWTRAELVAGLYEQRRVHHVGVFPQLEDQMTTFTGVGRGKSPDRLDALVWALSEFVRLPLGPTSGRSVVVKPVWDYSKPWGR